MSVASARMSVYVLFGITSVWQRVAALACSAALGRPLEGEAPAGGEGAPSLEQGVVQPLGRHLVQPLVLGAHEAGQQGVPGQLPRQPAGMRGRDRGCGSVCVCGGVRVRAWGSQGEVGEPGQRKHAASAKQDADRRHRGGSAPPQPPLPASLCPLLLASTAGPRRPLLRRPACHSSPTPSAVIAAPHTPPPLPRPPPSAPAASPPIGSPCACLSCPCSALSTRPCAPSSPCVAAMMEPKPDRMMPSSSSQPSTTPAGPRGRTQRSGQPRCRSRSGRRGAASRQHRHASQPPSPIPPRPSHTHTNTNTHTRAL
jgi:hypothetical protein